MSGTYTATFQPPTGTVWTSNDLQFTSPVVTETDVGAVSTGFGPGSTFVFSLNYIAHAHETVADFGGGGAVVNGPGQ